ncbi:MAG: hypothetical protein EBU90_11025 [Proteobacteria bacterium]|nr:hypothetical protein [Pseudomonadota bacterium]NBP14439.1 hypothetical protein [bacterium]
MAAINIARLLTLNGKLGVANVTTGYTDLLVNSSNSNTLLKINTLSLCNYSASTANVSVDVYRSNVGYRLASAISVPVNSSLIAITKDSMIYLEEGDSLRVWSGANNAIQAVISYDYIA